MLDDNFGLCEGETNDEGVGISSYLGGSIVNPSTVLSMSRVFAPDLLFRKTIHSTFMNGEEDTSKEESPLTGSVVLAS